MSEIFPVPGVKVTVRVEGECLPKGGNPGEVLVKTETGEEWRSLDDMISIRLEVDDDGNAVIFGGDAQ